MTPSEAVGVVLQSLDTVLEDQGIELPDTPNEDTALLGRGSVLDSLALVNLLLDIEQTVNEQLGSSITLANEQALSMRQSPFRTVRTLADYVTSLASEHDN